MRAGLCHQLHSAKDAVPVGLRGVRPRVRTVHPGRHRFVPVVYVDANVVPPGLERGGETVDVGSIQLAYAAYEFSVYPQCAGFGALELHAQHHSFHILAQFKIPLVADNSLVGVQPGELCADVGAVRSGAEFVLVSSPGQFARSQGGLPGA